MLFGVILVFAILASPKGFIPVETKRMINEAACLLESRAIKAYDELRSLVIEASIYNATVK